MADETGPSALAHLRRRLEEEDSAYSDALAALDALATYPLPEEAGPEVRALLEELKGLVPAPRPVAAGLGGALAGPALRALEPRLERQARLEEGLLQLLQAHLDHAARHHARLRELAAALVRYAQRVEPMVDARDAARVARAPTQAEQVLEVFGERLEAMGQRLEGLEALRDRVEVLSEESGALRRALSDAAPPPPLALAAVEAADDAVYTAFENRFRGSREEVRAQQARDVELLRGQGPVVDLGCGRGEFLELLRDAAVAALGVETSESAVRECREKGLDVVKGDALAFLQGREAGSLGGVFGAQVAEHLKPPVLAALLSEAHRALRRGGLLVLETPNPASALAFLQVFIRDLTHEKPLHPETLRYMAAAAGFSDVRIDMRHPVEDDVRLRLLPSSGLPPPVIQVLNENAARLNTLLFAPLDYALIARR